MSEARRRLPHLVQRVEREGGRVDITRRGEPVASIVRFRQPPARDKSSRSALRVELAFDAKELPEIVRDLRRRVGRALEK